MTDPDAWTLAVGALEHVCRTHNVELRATPEGVMLVPARPDWQGYEWRPAERPAGSVILLDRGDGPE
ncbi:hypothetical protein [Paracoccus beibuensis]|uniref:hypothetical protein n=1 Tax=Paracoccus beibuensis TaxID=547602 RepID=UPI00223FB570|nr:hypothetical protein [Paracoccus beibuensis]